MISNYTDYHISMMNPDFYCKSFILFYAPWHRFGLIKHLNPHFEESLDLIFFCEFIFHLILHNLNSCCGHICEADSLNFLNCKIMTQLIKLSKQLIHDQDDVFSFFLDDSFKVTDIAEQDWDFVLFLL